MKWDWYDARSHLRFANLHEAEVSSESRDPKQAESWGFGQARRLQLPDHHHDEDHHDDHHDDDNDDLDDNFDSGGSHLGKGSTKCTVAPPSSWWDQIVATCTNPSDQHHHFHEQSHNLHHTWELKGQLHYSLIIMLIILSIIIILGWLKGQRHYSCTIPSSRPLSCLSDIPGSLSPPLGQPVNDHDHGDDHNGDHYDDFVHDNLVHCLAYSGFTIMVILVMMVMAIRSR